MTDGVHIDFDGKRLRVTPPSWLIGKAKAIPDRRWHKSSRSWLIPLTPVNLKHLMNIYPNAAMTAQAHEAVAAMHDKLAERNRTVSERVPFPMNYPFKRPPMPHQLDGLNAVYGLHASALFAEMRVGKTKIVIDNLTMRRMNGDLDQVLVLAPNSVVLNWPKEVEKDCPLEYSALGLELSQFRQAERWVEMSGAFRWLVVAYESLSATGDRAFGLARDFAASGRTAIVADESHKIKNHRAQRTQRATHLAEMCQRRMIVTGTSITKDLLDLFAQLWFLDPSILPISSFYAFRNHFAVLGGFDNKQIIGYDHVEDLIECMKPVIFQIDRKEVEPNLPEKICETRHVEMTPAQREECRRIRTDADDEGLNKVLNALTKMLRLHQVAGGFRVREVERPDGKMESEEIWISDSKIDELLDVIDDVKGSVVIWAVYQVEIVHIIEALVKKYGPCARLDGSVSREDREVQKELFQTGQVRFIVGNASTGGLGIDLSAGDTVIFYSSTFNYSDRKQAEDRVQHLKRTKGVLYIDLRAKGSVDASVLEALALKQNLADFVKEALAAGRDVTSLMEG